jgi:CRP/FNR family cyclic AMP-dependent transcriptional regulator
MGGAGLTHETLLAAEKRRRATNRNNWPPGSLLAELPDAARDRLFGIGALRAYPHPGEVLIREGDSTSSVFLLLSGLVKVTGRTEGGDALLAIRVGGDFVGELSALDGRKRLATVTTASPVGARVVGRAEFNGFLGRNPDIALAVTRGIADKLRSATARRIDFTSCAVGTRFARVLLELAERYGEQAGTSRIIRCPLTQTELATLVGAAEPSVHRVLRRLRTGAVVATGYRQTTVLDMAALRRLAFPDGIEAVNPNETVS